MFPVTQLPPLPTLSLLSLESIQLTTGTTLASVASAVWTSANRAIFIPFHLNTPSVVKLLWVLNGATISGNLDIGIYDARASAKIISAGATAQAAGANAIQTVDIADTVLGAGDYYLACVMDNGTGTVFRAAPGLAAARGAGLLQMAAAYPLPATATPVALTSAFVPFCGLRFYGTVI